MAYVTRIVLAIIGDTLSGALVIALESRAAVAIDLVVANARGFTLDTTLLKRLKRARDGDAYPGWYQLDAVGLVRSFVFFVIYRNLHV